MSDVANFDKAMRVEPSIVRDGMRFYDIEQTPFSIHGIFREGDHFRRLPKAVSETVNDGVDFLASNTAGGRVRFVTDSDRMAIVAKICSVGKMPHFALTGSVGFDVYADEGDGSRYAGSLIPPFEVDDEFEAEVRFLDRRTREITVNFPLYSGVRSLYIGIADDASLSAATPYANELPVMFYGSSITQGGCASRPGNSYQAILSRRMGFDYVNLGFSGSARAEDTMIDYLADMPMKVFVLDYDHNAPDASHLENTHEKLFKAVRAKSPDLPILMMTRPKHRLNSDEERRLAIVRATYDHAVAAGDDRVYMIDGRELIGAEFADIATVDGVHPNDVGFYAMARRIEPTLKQML